MNNFEVNEPILNSPFKEPKEYWWILVGEAPERRAGRRFAHYFYRDPCSATKESAETDVGTMIELKLVTRIRERLAQWRPAELRDLFLAPYYEWVIERLSESIRTDSSHDESAELPRYESHRDPGSTGDVDFWTSRHVREVIRSHVNFVVADTKKWKQSVTYLIDTHPAVTAFVKNAGLGFAIPYIDNGQVHDYVPDFILRLNGHSDRHMILETKGFDELEDVKKSAAERWINAVNADGGFGIWTYAIAKKVSDVPALIASAAH